MRGPLVVLNLHEHALKSKTKFGFFLDWAHQETRRFIVLFMIFLVTEKQQAPFWRTIMNVLLCGCILLHEHLLCFDEHPLLVFFAKKRNSLQNINKSFNLVLPCAKLKSHTYLTRNKTMFANVILCLTWCNDLWSHSSVLPVFGA